MCLPPKYFRRRTYPYVDKCLFIAFVLLLRLKWVYGIVFAAIFAQKQFPIAFAVTVKRKSWFMQHLRQLTVLFRSGRAGTFLCQLYGLPCAAKFFTSIHVGADKKLFCAKISETVSGFIIFYCTIGNYFTNYCC